MVTFWRTPDLGLLDRDHRHVGLQHRAQQVPLRGNLLVDHYLTNLLSDRLYRTSGGSQMC